MKPVYSAAIKVLNKNWVVAMLHMPTLINKEQSLLCRNSFQPLVKEKIKAGTM
jgi:hypothetical protein